LQARRRKSDRCVCGPQRVRSGVHVSGKRKPDVDRGVLSQPIVQLDEYGRWNNERFVRGCDERGASLVIGVVLVERGVDDAPV
jgi:hypothetical protein